MHKPMQAIAALLRMPWVPPAQGKAAYLWVLSLGFLFWKYLYQPPGPLECACLAATLLLFVPLYFASYWARGARSLLCVALSCLFGVLWAPHNFGASSFFIFAAAMCAGVQPPRRAYGAMALVMLLALLMGQLTRWELSFLIPCLLVGIPVGVAAIMESSLRRSRGQLLRKQEEVEHMATIAERERISRDLHDLLGHTLSLITLKAELAGKLLDRDAEACRKEIKDIETSARTALSEVRSAVSGYRQSGFAHELASARASLAAAQVELVARVDAFTLPAAAENVMSLALREAVTNIVRHAVGATRCEVSLVLGEGVIRFRIADNGQAPASSLRHGNGLTGMQERVLALGGKLALRSEPGLALELSLPVGVRT